MMSHHLSLSLVRSSSINEKSLIYQHGTQKYRSNKLGDLDFLFRYQMTPYGILYVFDVATKIHAMIEVLSFWSHTSGQLFCLTMRLKAKLALEICVLKWRYLHDSISNCVNNGLRGFGHVFGAPIDLAHPLNCEITNFTMSHKILMSMLL